jgi:phosphoglycolate phosphatase
LAASSISQKYPVVKHFFQKRKENKKMEKLQGLLFDLDGTLVDSSPGIQEAINVTMERLGFPTHSRSELEAMMGNGARKLIMLALPEAYRNDDEMIDRALNMYDQAYEECCVAGAVPYEGIQDAVQELHKRGVKLAVLSNKQDVCTQKIVSTHFPNAFDMICGQTDAPLKPDPTVPTMIAATLGLKPSEMAEVGDTDVDVKTAKNAKMNSIGVTWGYRSREVLIASGTDVLIDAPQELLGFFAPTKKSKKSKKKDEPKMKRSRMTAQKQKMLEVFSANRTQLFNAEEVLAILDKAGEHIGLATIYRNLKAFEEEGRLTRVTLTADSAARYRYAGDNPVVQTYHKFVCSRCGSIDTLDSDLVRRMERMVCAETKQTINDHQLLFYGICRTCRRFK